MPVARWPQQPEWRRQLEKNWNDLYGDRRQEIVFIGTNMDEGAIRSRLDACLVDGKPGMHVEEWKALPDPFPRCRRDDERAA